MQDRVAIVRGPHLCNLLSFGDLIAFFDQDLSVVPIGTQIFVIMFDDDKPAVADQSTTAVYNLATLGRQNRFPSASGDLDPLAQWITGLEAGNNSAPYRPTPGEFPCVRSFFLGGFCCRFG